MEIDIAIKLVVDGMEILFLANDSLAGLITIKPKKEINIIEDIDNYWDKKVEQENIDIFKRTVIDI